MSTMAPLFEQVVAGQYAASELREARTMIALIEQWDSLPAAQKSAEWDKHQSPQTPSRFAEVPGFDPVFCLSCQNDVFPDFREDPDGECPVDAGHQLFTIRQERAAA